MKLNRIPTSVRLDPATVKLIEKEEKRTGKGQTEVIEGTLTTVLNLSERALGILESTAERTGKKESRILEDCIIALLAPGKGMAK